MKAKEALEILKYLYNQRYIYKDEIRNKPNEALGIAIQALDELEELKAKIKDTLALNFSYQEISIKIVSYLIERLFKEEMK